MSYSMRLTLFIQFLFMPIILFIFVCLLAGCAGTTHHFLPPRPLEKNEIMISWSWNHDFNNWNVPTFVPSINVYAGLQNHDNVGAGFQLSGITHISYARYSGNNNSRRIFYYVHLNQPLGSVHDNPYFELGGGYINYRDGTYHMFSAGLGVGHGMSYGLIEVLPRIKSQRKDASDFIHVWRVIPTLKYAAMGRDLSSSLSYYYGKSDLIYDNIINAVTRLNDTLLYVHSDELDSIGIAKRSFGTIQYDSPAIFLKNDSIVYLFQETFDEIDLNMFSTWNPLLRECDYQLFRIYLEGKESFFGNLNDLSKTIVLGNDLLITKYSDSILPNFHRPVGIWKDLSIGVGAMQIR